MSSDSDSSFDLPNSVASSDFSMESFDDVKVGERESFNSSMKDAIPKASDVKITSESSSGDVVTSQDATIESPKPQMPEASETTASSETSSGDAVTGLGGSDATIEDWRTEVTTGLRNRIVFDVIKDVVTDDSYNQLVADISLREKMCFEKAKNLKEYWLLVAEDFYSMQTMMTQAGEDVRQPKIGKPSVDVAETPESSEPKTTTSSSKSKSSRLQTSSKPTGASAHPEASKTLKSPESMEQDKLILDTCPFIAEIIGCWKVVSYQKAYQLSSATYNHANLSDFTGTILKIDFSNNQIESYKYYKYYGSNKILKFYNFFQITSTHIFSQKEKFSYRIENNVLISRYDKYDSTRLDKAWIQDGKLQIERDNGRIKMVLKRTELTRNWTLSPTTKEIIRLLFCCLFCLLIGLLITFLLACSTASLIMNQRH